VYEVFPDVLDRLQPTHIITQTQCEVCAVSLKDVEAALASGLASNPQIVPLHPNALADVWDDIRRVAGALGIAERGEATVEELKARMCVISRRALSRPERPTVACIEWLEPLMAAGNWVPELVEMAGGVNLFGEAGKHSPWMSWEELVRADPEVIVVMPCGWDPERTRPEMHWLTDRPEWAQLRAVRSGRVHLTDGNQYFNRPGPRLVESLEILAAILHPL
jgi:iron complex transport system substrate-binding protein